MNAPIFTLVDVNNFYASCESNFNPAIANVPVCVLSNGEGCVVARSKEVKALGVKMGTPWFQIRDLAKEHGIIAFSSNYALYQNMSQRVHSILRDMSPDLETYSIDECFCRVDTVAHLYGGVDEMGHAMKDRIKQWTGLAVCAGSGPTKTLAKFANFLAKKNAVFNGVCDLISMPKPERLRWMAGVDVGDVWGVGQRIAARLRAMHINSVLDLRNTSPKTLRAQFGVVMERTGNELRGISCLGLEDVPPPRKQIIVSRSFGAVVTSFDELRESIVTYASTAAIRLREQGSVAAAIQVFVSTNAFKTDEPQYSASHVVPLVDPSDDTRELIAAALAGLKSIYRSGYWYKKSGVVLIDISSKEIRQRTLFDDDEARDRSARLMAVLDRANCEFGRGTLTLAAAGLAPRWALRFSKRSPRYTTRWDELPIVK